MNVISIGLYIYSLYSYLAYNHLRNSQFEAVSKDFINRYGLNWMENESLVIQYASEISRWPIGSLFSNTKIHSFILLVFISLLIAVIVLYGILSLLSIVIIVFVSNLLVGILFKGVGIHYSIILTLILGLIITFL